MHLDFALALEDDPLDDPTAEWEGDRELVRLGTLEVTEVIEDPETPDRPLVFDPMRLTDGIQPSADPRRPTEGVLRLDRAANPRLISRGR